jgi:hypothetical protein
MATSTKKKPEVKEKSISADSKKNITSHTNAAKHHEAAAIFHHEAANHYAAGNDEKAHKSSIMASGHATEAKSFHKEVTKRHTTGK